MQVARESKSGPLVVADPFFGEAGVRKVAEGDAARRKRVPSRTARRSITAGDDLSTVYFAPLSGTALEAGTIKSLFLEARS
jgi:hypothetical protein